MLSCCCFVCIATQDAASSGSAAQELPGVCAETLLKLYTDTGPKHLQPVVKQALKKQLQ